MIKKSVLLIFISISFFSLMASAQPKLQEFKGVVTSSQETEVYSKDPIKTDNFCCDRKIKTGDAHEPRYKIEALVNRREEEDPQAPLKPRSKGRQ